MEDIAKYNPLKLRLVKIKSKKKKGTNEKYKSY